MVNIKKGMKILLLLSLVIALPGCKISFSGRTEMNRIEFVRALGVDKCPEYEDSVRLTIATQRIKTGGEEGQQKTSEILYSSGRTVFEAIRNFWNYMDKRPFWGHLEYVLIGEEAAKDGLLKYIDYFNRDPEVRLNLKVYVTDGLTAEEVITKGSGEDKFVFDRLEGIAVNQWGQSVYNITDLIEVMYMLDNEHLSLYIPIIKLEAFTLGGQDAHETMDIVMGGFAIFEGDKLVGELDDKMGRGLNWLRNKIESGIITVKSPQGKCISLEIIESKSKMIPKIIDDQITVNVVVGVSSSIGGLRSSEDIFNEETLGNLEHQQVQTIKNEIESVIEYAQKRSLDFFGASDAIFHKYPIQWEDKYQKDWNEIFPNIKFNVIMSSRIIRTYDFKQPNRSEDGDEK